MVQAVTKETYAQTVEKSAKPVLLDVWAPWCQPCRAIEPMIEELKVAFDDQLVVVKLNADDEPELAAQLGVMGLPTVRVLQGGQARFESVGSVDKAKLADAVGAAIRGAR
ncbi:MAG TPA: thioredoxin domain-containing protein [Candidatus Saccharimonadia bacterium]|nr:thioredoxin domain-containing protein [Candidatus Saccharimonadia bacterium]